MIISLSGLAGAGKDESARHLTIAHEFQRAAFADKLKELALAVNPSVIIGTRHVMDRDPISGELSGPGYNTTKVTGLAAYVALHGWDSAKQHHDVRRFLQTLGNSVREVFDEYIWIHAVEERVLSSRNVVVTDSRYMNELDWLGSIGAYLVKIERPGLDVLNDHVSEHDWQRAHFPYTIVNDGAVADLAAKLDLLMAHLREAEGVSRRWRA